MENKIISVLLSVATIIFLIIVPIMLIGFSQSSYQSFYYDDFKINAVDQEFLTNSVLDYIRGVNVAMVPFSPTEISHLDDVQMLIGIAEMLFIVSVILLLLFIPFIWWYKQNRKLVLQLLFIGSGVAFSFVLMVGVISWFRFEKIFVIFHNVLFPQGGWEFASTDLLIMLFPLEVFQFLASRIFITSISLSAVVLLLSYLFLYKFNK